MKFILIAVIGAFSAGYYLHSEPEQTGVYSDADISAMNNLTENALMESDTGLFKLAVSVKAKQKAQEAGNVQ